MSVYLIFDVIISGGECRPHNVLIMHISGLLE